MKLGFPGEPDVQEKYIQNMEKMTSLWKKKIPKDKDIIKFLLLKLEITWDIMIKEVEEVDKCLAVNKRLLTENAKLKKGLPEEKAPEPKKRQTAKEKKTKPNEPVDLTAPATPGSLSVFLFFCFF